MGLVHDYIETIESKKAVKVGNHFEQVNCTALMVRAPTHREGDTLTQSLREALKNEGMLSRQEHPFTIRDVDGLDRRAEERRSELRPRNGDRVSAERQGWIR